MRDLPRLCHHATLNPKTGKSEFLCNLPAGHTGPHQTKKSKPTGRVNVYIRWCENFFDRLRPAHDSAADAIGELTESEVNTLRAMITRYINKCHERHGKAMLDEAVNKRNQYA